MSQLSDEQLQGIKTDIQRLNNPDRQQTYTEVNTFHRPDGSSYNVRNESHCSNTQAYFWMIPSTGQCRITIDSPSNVGGYCYGDVIEVGRSRNCGCSGCAKNEGTREAIFEDAKAQFEQYA